MHELVPAPRREFGSRERFVTLDAMRGLAAVFVMLYHMEIALGVHGPFGHAYLAVDFFFMLSGFVLSRTYDRRFADGLPLADFMRSRVARLWPTIAVGIMIGALLHLFKGDDAGLVALATAMHLMLIPMLVGGLDLFPINGVIWSLMFELIANALHRIALFHLGQRWMLVAVVGLAVTVSVLSSHFGGIFFGYTGPTILLGLPRVLLPYLMGMGLQRLFTERGPLIVCPWYVPTILLALVLAGSAVPSVSAQWQTDPVIVIAIFPAIILLGAGSTVPRSAVALASGAGALSYPLYAIHLPLLGFAEALSVNQPVGMKLSLFLCALVIALVGARLLSKLLAAKPSSRTVAVPA